MVVAFDFTKDGKDARRFKRFGPNLYRRGAEAKIYARVKVEGKMVWRSTETDEPETARAVLKEWREQQILRRNGIEPPVAALERQRLTINQAIDLYIAANFPDRKMRSKRPSTIETETKCFARLRPFFGDRPAIGLTPKDCDAYREWRMSGGYTWERAGESRKSKAGDRLIDIELQTLSNVLTLTARRQKIRFNPLRERTRYHREEDTRHCREVAPTPQQLEIIERYLRQQRKNVIADCIMFLAFSGLRINEALPLDWEPVDWKQQLIHVRREKRGINPWVPIMNEMQTLLHDMKARSKSHLLFPSQVDPAKPIAYSTVAGTLARVCRNLGMKHVTPHGLRSYYVTRCREAGLPDAEIAMLIGDRSGPAIIALTYGDVLPTHLFAQCKRVRLLVRKSDI
jgi:integrase